jgi:hypothetical protein
MATMNNAPSRRKMHDESPLTEMRSKLRSPFRGSVTRAVGLWLTLPLQDRPGANAQVGGFCLGSLRPEIALQACGVGLRAPLKNDTLSGVS